MMVPLATRININTEEAFFHRLNDSDENSPPIPGYPIFEFCYRLAPVTVKTVNNISGHSGDSATIGEYICTKSSHKKILNWFILFPENCHIHCIFYSPLQYQHSHSQSEFSRLCHFFATSTIEQSNMILSDYLYSYEDYYDYYTVLDDIHDVIVTSSWSNNY